ncbi:MAG: hypothetical protein DI533_00325 [Cereibacter sphaeroides]|uniref:Helix-turn-helix domain-containing protein n=1 Tax=Cereibacter sphaeroides TaxID=1063 RepID=A0A2W5S892_CERSP|nr:MAG: hypothetical protein DI533_00325 [Cereibacter sphaeroides]
MTQTEWTDRELLTALQMTGEGMSARQVAKALGRSRNAVLGVLMRLRDEYARLPDRASKPTNVNNGMPAQWWLDGLAKQEAGHG